MPLIPGTRPDNWEVFDSPYCLWFQKRFLQCLHPDYGEIFNSAFALDSWKVLTVLTAPDSWKVFDGAYSLITGRFFTVLTIPDSWKVLTVLTAWLLAGFLQCLLSLIPGRFWQCWPEEGFWQLLPLTPGRFLTVLTAWLLWGFWQCLLPDYWEGFDSAYTIITKAFVTVPWFL